MNWQPFMNDVYYACKMSSNNPGIKLEAELYRLDKKTKLNICHHNIMLTASAQLQNRSFNVVERTRTSAKFPKIKNVCATHAKLLFSLSNMEICEVLIAVVAVA